MNELDDILLFKLIKAGDEQAFKYLFDTYFVSTCRYMHLYLGNPQEAEELAVDIFMYLWENKEKIEIKLSFKAYLFQAARNRCLNHLRDRKQICSIDDIADSKSSTDFPYIEIDELNHLIEEAVSALPEKCKEVFCKSRNQNLTNQEISEDMKISIKTVEAQITKALKCIKKSLGEEYRYLF